MTLPETIQKATDEMAKDLSQHIEEFACAFLKKVNVDPRKVVMIHHFDVSTGKDYYWFEKKRGRSRKDIINNNLKQK